MNIKPKSPNSRKDKPEKRPPKRISATYLHNAGLYYLERFAASSNHFRSVMLRKVRKSCQHHEDQKFEDCAALVDELVQKFERAGLLNDEIYTRGMVTSLRRQGKSRQAIQGKLRAKGLEQDVIADTLTAHDEAIQEHSGTAAELRAAIVFARKKRLGPFQRPGKINEIDENKLLQKSLGSFARNGFSYDTAQIVLKMSLKEAEKTILP